MSNEMNKFSYWLMQQLSEKNITQSQLARETGLTRQAISYFIKGEGKRPEDESLRLIAKALKVSIDEIYRGAGILPRWLRRRRCNFFVRQFMRLDGAAPLS
jgi:transcriptional regulator with XRE-family HTH domain